uniref:Uncharacterized protein n=1 Tax=Ignisphaera aggregans TaxID=334771 RepID=A0A7C5XMU7_9CREN
MPRARKNKNDKKMNTTTEKLKVAKPQEEINIKDKKTTTKRKYIDTESWVEKHLKELIEAFGLQFLNLTDDEFMKIIVNIVDMIRGESSSLDLDVITRRFKRNLMSLYPLIASMVLELRDSLTDEQIEFVVNNIGEAVLAYASRLYKDLVARERNDLIDRLKDYWNKYWVLKKHPILPVLCPNCRFNSLMPDLTCMVCGSIVSEKELKESINFMELLKDFVKNNNIEDVKKAINYGYVYLSSIGVKPPSENRDPLDIEIVLSNNEKEYLKFLIEYKQGV